MSDETEHGDMELPGPVADRLARLAPDQRAAATAPPGPVLCVAPAGSGKTTTLVARVAWLVAGGVPPDQIAAITFNRKAALELADRIAPALTWLPDAAGDAQSGSTRGVRVRTFHALGLEILRDAGGRRRLMDRAAVIRGCWPGTDRATLGRLDTAFSRLKLDLDVTARDVAADPEAGPIARAYVAYEQALEAAGAIDFDDLVRLALHALRADPRLLSRWRTSCSHLLVDETQDVDRSQLELALLLAAPANRIFLVGDDDQSIYGWRLADVRRVLGLAGRLPGLRRIDLEVNYRCPAPVLERSVRLVERNGERFAKAIRAGPAATGRLVLAPDPSDDAERVRRIVASWAGAEGTWAILARTNRELLPVVAVALDLGLPFRAPAVRLLIEAAGLDAVIAAVEASSTGRPLLVRIQEARRRLASAGPGAGAEQGARDAVLGDEDAAGSDGTASDTADHDDSEPSPDALASALLAWAPPFSDVASLRTAIQAARERLATLRTEDARLTLATAHATKGLEFDHVALIGMDEGRFPSARSIADSEDPARALEEERRLAYVAWTRARRSLTLVYDPAAPSSFLLEAFDADELGLAKSTA